MVSVKVVSRSSGKPVKSAKVSISFGLLGGITSAKFTDSNGEAHFDTSPGEGTVYVNGREVKKGHFSGMVVVYI